MVGITTEAAIARIVDHPTEVASHLENVGIPVSALTKAVSAGAGGFNATTLFHPKSGPGTYLYQEATAGLRRGLISHGGDWDFDEDDRQPRTFSANRRTAIVVQTGDENTGINTGIEPRPRNPKGAATQKKVSANSQQLALFNITPSGAPTANNGEMLTWILLIAIVGEKVRAELSLPRRWSSAGKPYGWLVRVLLPEQDLTGSSMIDVSNPGVEGPVTDIDVAWKL